MIESTNFYKIDRTGKAGSRILHQPAELGARELCVPKKQNQKVQCAPDLTAAGVVQISTADSQQSAGESAKPVLRELSQRLVRAERFYGLRPRRRSHRHVPQDEDREALQLAEPDI